MLDVFSSVCQAVSGHWVYRLHCRAQVWSVSVPSRLQQHNLESHGRQQCSHLSFMSKHRYHKPTGDSLHWPLPSLAEWHAAGRECPCSSGYFGGFPVFLSQFGPSCHPGDWPWPHVTNEPGLFLLADTRFGLMALYWGSLMLVKIRSGPCLQNSCIHIVWWVKLPLLCVCLYNAHGAAPQGGLLSSVQSEETL